MKITQFTSCYSASTEKKNMWNHVNHVKGMFCAMPCLSRLVSFTPYPRPKEQKKATWKDLGTAGGGESFADNVV